MTASNCLDPTNCPVPSPPGPLVPRRLRTVTWPAEKPFFRAYDLRWGYDGFNPGHGSTRFAPVTEPEPVATMYGGADETVALLESIFHDVGVGAAPRIVYEASLRARGLAHLVAPRPLRLFDLRDAALQAVGLARSQLVATDAAHYACTRQWGVWLRTRRPGGFEPDGILWHSRQTELASHPAGEVFVLWADRAPSGTGAYGLVGPGVRNLVEGRGRLFIERVAESLDALIEPG